MGSVLSVWKHTVPSTPYKNTHYEEGIFRVKKIERWSHSDPETYINLRNNCFMKCF